LIILNLKKISILILLIILCYSAFSVNAFDGDYLLIHKNIFEQNNNHVDKLIIENRQFSFSDFVQNDGSESETNTSNNISMIQLLTSVEKLKAEKELAIKNADMYSAGINIKYPFYITHTTVEEYNYILKGSHLEGYGYCFKKIEDEYGVNGLFAISVATQESGLGRSALGQNKNNFYGIRGGGSSWAQFDSIEAGIVYFGKLMNKSWYFGKTISEIAPIYCNEEWGSKVSRIISLYVSKIERMEG
jgi:beta-N-acetylglucosaminidase